MRQFVNHYLFHATIVGAGILSQTWWYPQYVDWAWYIVYLILGSAIGALLCIGVDNLFQRLWSISLFERRWTGLLTYVSVAASLVGLGYALLILP
jgi:hypothetical protein